MQTRYWQKVIAMTKIQKAPPKNTVIGMAIQTDDEGANELTNTKMLAPRLT